MKTSLRVVLTVLNLLSDTESLVTPIIVHKFEKREVIKPEPTIINITNNIYNLSGNNSTINFIEQNTLTKEKKEAPK